MKKCYLVSHDRNARVAFPLTDEQIRFEYANFRRTLSHLFRHEGIEASCDVQSEAVCIELQGAVDEETLDAAMQSFLLTLNYMKIDGRIGSLCLVVNDTSLPS